MLKFLDALGGMLVEQTLQVGSEFVKDIGSRVRAESAEEAVHGSPDGSVLDGVIKILQRAGRQGAKQLGGIHLASPIVASGDEDPSGSVPSAGEPTLLVRGKVTRVLMKSA